MLKLGRTTKSVSLDYETFTPLNSMARDTPFKRNDVGSSPTEGTKLAHPRRTLFNNSCEGYPPKARHRNQGVIYQNGRLLER